MGCLRLRCSNVGRPETYSHEQIAELAFSILGKDKKILKNTDGVR